MYYSLYASSWVNSELSCFYEKNNCLVINQLDCIQSYNDDLASFSFFYERSKIIGINRDFIQKSNSGFIKSNRNKTTLWFNINLILRLN